MSVLSGFLQQWNVTPLSVRVLILSMFVWEIGLAMYDPLMPIYLGDLGASAQEIGLVFSFTYLVSAVVSLPAGWLADHFDRKRVMVVCWMIGVPSVLVFAWADTWQATLLGFLLYFMSFVAFPSINAYLASSISPEALSRTFAYLYASFPAAQLLGPSLGGLIAEQAGIRSVFFVAFGLYAISTLMVLLIEGQKPQKPVYEKGAPPAFRDGPWFRPAFLRRMALATLALFYFTALLRFFAPMAVDVYGYSLAGLGILSSIAALGGTLLTPLFGQWGDRGKRLGALAASLGLYALSLLLTGLFDQPVLLAAGFLLQGCFFAARGLMDSIIGSLGDSTSTGRLFGVFFLFSGLGSALGPLVGGWLYATNPQTAFLVFAGGGLALAAVTGIWSLRYETT